MTLAEQFSTLAAASTYETGVMFATNHEFYEHDAAFIAFCGTERGAILRALHESAVLHEADQAQAEHPNSEPSYARAMIAEAEARAKK